MGRRRVGNSKGVYLAAIPIYTVIDIRHYYLLKYNNMKKKTYPSILMWYFILGIRHINE